MCAVIVRGILFALLAGCASPQGHTASARVPCTVEGTWTISWSTSPAIAVSQWGFDRERLLTIERTTDERLDRDGYVRVDRARCVVHLLDFSSVNFSDDAGTRTERLAMEIDLADPRGTVRGT